MPNIVGVITARGGSEGIPRKNVRLLAGKPLIAWTIEAALRSRWLSRVIVSTDNLEISAISRRFGAEIPFLRPDELSRDDSSHVDVLCHAIEWLRDNEDYHADYVVTLQPTSPLRITEDIDGAVELAVSRQADAVVGVCPSPAHPYLIKRIDETGQLVDFVVPDVPYMRRQSLPSAYVFNGAVYVNQAARLLADRHMFPVGTLGYVMPSSRSDDIDNEMDFRLVEFQMNARFEQRQAA